MHLVIIKIMPCINPQSAFKGRDGSVTFVRKDAIANLKLDCQQCIECRKKRSLHWGIRMMHEASMHENNMFLTLTYDDEHLPVDESLHLQHFQKFMKAYRNKISPTKIRFFHCGEYGTDNRRPHYHAIIFGHEFSDIQNFGKNLCTSEQLNELWQNGFTTIGNVTLESATYVAKYILKKVTGSLAPEHYSHITRYGEEVSLTPEYTTMSRRPGIASTWYEEFKNDIHPEDFISIKGKKLPVPKYYNKKYKAEDPEGYLQLRKRQLKIAKETAHNRTSKRLKVIEKCAIARQTIRKL